MRDGIYAQYTSGLEAIKLQVLIPLRSVPRMGVLRGTTVSRMKLVTFVFSDKKVANDDRSDRQSSPCAWSRVRQWMDRCSERNCCGSGDQITLEESCITSCCRHELLWHACRACIWGGSRKDHRHGDNLAFCSNSPYDQLGNVCRDLVGSYRCMVRSSRK